jgi:hypothetical protein
MMVQLDRILEALDEVPETFLCSASFESRSRSVAERIDPAKVKRVLIFANVAFHKDIGINAELIKERFGDKATIVPLRIDDPLFVADTFTNQVIPHLKAYAGLCLIDVTSFTHEQLLIFIRVLSDLDPSRNIKLVYTGAAEYSVGLPPQEKWLSKGLSETRAVLGYPGVMLPSKRLHLIVLVGFEYERAEKLIESYEPALISLGLGHRDQSVSSDHHKLNTEFHERVRKFAKAISNSMLIVRKFEFSCVDPCKTMEDIIKQIAKYPGYNIALCPMNTKPSTIGAGLAALSREQIQLVYAQPVEYNLNGYSTPGDTCTIFDLSECLATARDVPSR